MRPQGSADLHSRTVMQEFRRANPTKLCKPSRLQVEVVHRRWKKQRTQLQHQHGMPAKFFSRPWPLLVLPLSLHRIHHGSRKERSAAVPLWLEKGKRATAACLLSTPPSAAKVSSVCSR
mmetsp:Transcript_87232/g.219609  ORF Transcript_87232/g.219609 Transcript_87232/m.219609 type:complete len:119 (+) Transcript_87232:1178-1534(+)